MDGAIAPPQTSFLDKVGDVFTGLKKGIFGQGIPVDSRDRLVADSVAPPEEVVAKPTPTPVVTPAAIPAVNNGITEKDRNIANAANADGNPKALLAAASQADTPDAHKALTMLAGNRLKGEAKYAETLKKVDDKGGIDSTEGRMEYAKLWQNRDNSPEFAKAFTQYLLGNVNAAKRYLSGGEVVNKTQIDTTTGHAIQYAVDENGEYHGAYDLKTGQQLLPSQFGAMVGNLGTLEQSVPYVQYKENIKNWTTKFNDDVENANVKGAAADSMYNAYDTLSKALESKDLSPLMAQEILQFSKQTIGSSASESKAAQALKQRIDSGSLTVGTKVSSEFAASIGAGIPGLANATFKGNGIFETSEGNKIDINQLSQGMSSANSNAAREKSLTANAEDVLRNAKAKGLFEQDPTGVKYKQFTAALDIAKTIALQEAKIGSNPFNLPTIGFGVTDEFARGKIQAEQGKFNQLANKAYAQYANEMTKQFGQGDAPRPGNLLKGFVASDEYKALLADYKNKANTILKTADTYVTPKNVNLADKSVAVPAPAQPAVGQNVLQQFGTGNTVAADLAALKAAKEKPAGSAAPPTKKTPSLDDIASKFRK
jgi:hypothetical protein